MVGGVGIRKWASQTRVAIAGPTRRLRGRLNPKKEGAALVVAGLVFVLNANPGTTGTAIPLPTSHGSPFTLGGGCIPYGDFGWGLAEAREGCQSDSVEAAGGSRGACTRHARLPRNRGKARATSGVSPGLWGRAGAAEWERMLYRNRFFHVEDRSGLVAGGEDLTLP